MRAVLCKELGPPESLVVEDVPTPELKPGQVLVKVGACGVNFPDTLIIQGKYQHKPELPFSPGGEIAGEVIDLAADVSGVTKGDRVIALCGHGGFAEEIAIDANRLVPIPDEMDYVTASAFLLTYGTSYHALKQRAQLQPGETLLVLGAAGGVGLAAVELGKAMGAKVIAAASTPEKLALAKEHGADELINYSNEDLKDRVKELTGGKGVDVVYDPVGADLFEPAVRATGWNGRILVVGFAGGYIPKLPVNLTLLKGSSVVGVFWGEFTRRQPKDSAENNKELLDMFLQGKVKPHISQTFTLDKAADALNVLQNRQAKGKLVVTTD
ncbi:NADPH:quinone oxidoreductase family protein [Gilvimarinus sp. F26214L]|uniref:NADPH:quinone oxidoreductase family protein n=1 Tax=Gilvimarinus sp. DZF01 TaxID=3461371 RepID=UPI004046692E